MKRILSKYLAEGKMYEALLVAQNAVYKTCDKANFESYWDLLIKLTNETDDLVIASKYAEKANELIAFFAENIEINEDMVDFIIEKRQQLDNVKTTLNSKQLGIERMFVAESVKENGEYLDLINRLADDIESIDNEEQFKKRLEQIRLIDDKIKSNYLSVEQKHEYEKLTSKCSNIVEKKTSYFEYKKNLAYNNSAVEAYERAFNFIKTGKGLGTDASIVKEMFMFDASRLFSETLIYYNHVYSYIFNKLSDDEKLILTKAAINSSKKR